MIYLDNAATTLHKPEGVAEAMITALTSMGNSGRGAHKATLDASRMIYGTREKLAELFHISDPMRIAFTCNATESLNIAIQGILQPGDHVITSVCEHNSVLRPVYRMAKRGVTYNMLPADKKGVIQYDQLTSLLKKETKAIVITHASNLTGNVTDLKKVSDFAKKNGLLLIVDASQTAGCIPIDVQELGIDVLCFPGHKGLMGPQGTGGIYVREGIKIAPLKVGGSGVKSFDKEHPDTMPTALEAGTLNGPGIAGLGASVSWLLKQGVEKIHEKDLALSRRFLKGIAEIPDITIYGDMDSQMRTAIVSLNLGDVDSAEMSDWLWEDYGIAVRAGAHCAPLMHKALGTEQQGAVRFSFSCFNTEEEVDAAIQALKELQE
ncbi:aminotransferase class V-fold PLP-dependent enzyme [Lacrimispora saccharolytica]|nr:aminotransferase class V-fold PLP-dependent enzyme [Lacrimispora saccharolytica]